MNLVVALEEEFNILFSDEEIVEIISLEAVEKSLLSKL
jgi:acyl carrier protein